MTRTEAEDRLRAEGVDRRTYNLSGALQNDSWILDGNGRVWIVFYFERGDRYEETQFGDESSALEYLVGKVLADPTTRAKYWKNPQI